MRTNVSPRLLLMVLAIVTLISTPVMGLLFPIFYVQTFLYERSTMILYPHEMNFRLVMLACILLFAAFILPLIKQSKLTYGLMSCLIASSLFVFYLSVLSYVLVGKEAVTSNNLFDKKTMQWSEMTKVTLEYAVDDTGVHEAYIFSSVNGELIRILLTAQFQQEDKNEIYRLAKEKGVHFIEQQKQ